MFEPEPEPLEKKLGAEAGPAKKIAGSPALQTSSINLLTQQSIYYLLRSW